MTLLAPRLGTLTMTVPRVETPTGARSDFDDFQERGREALWTPGKLCHRAL
jgi:hypothetical protein